MEAWSEITAIVWIATRDERLTIDAAKRQSPVRKGVGLALASAFTTQAVADHVSNGLSYVGFDQATSMLLSELQAGRIEATAVRADKTRVVLPAAKFLGASLGENLAEDGIGFLREFDGILVRSDQVRGLWPKALNDLAVPKFARIRLPSTADEFHDYCKGLAATEIAARRISKVSIMADWPFDTAFPGRDSVRSEVTALRNRGRGRPRK